MKDKIQGGWQLQGKGIKKSRIFYLSELTDKNYVKLSLYSNILSQSRGTRFCLSQCETKLRNYFEYRWASFADTRPVPKTHRRPYSSQIPCIDLLKLWKQDTGNHLKQQVWMSSAKGMDLKWASCIQRQVILCTLTGAMSQSCCNNGSSPAALCHRLPSSWFPSLCQGNLSSWFITYISTHCLVLCDQVDFCSQTCFCN